MPLHADAYISPENGPYDYILAVFGQDKYISSRFVFVQVYNFVCGMAVCGMSSNFVC